MGAKHGPPQSSSALALMHLTCGHYARSSGYHSPCDECGSHGNHRMPSSLPPGLWPTEHWPSICLEEGSYSWRLAAHCEHSNVPAEYAIKERKKTIPPTLPGEPILQWSGSLAVTSCWTSGFSRHRATRHQCDRHQWTFCYDCTTEKTRVIDQWGGEKLLLLSHDTGIWWNPSAVSCIRLHVKYSLLHLRYWMLTLSTALYCFFFFFLNMSAPVYDWQSVAKLKSSVTQFLITISECVNVRRYTFCDSVLAAQ